LNQDGIQTNHKEPNSQDNHGSNMGGIHHFPPYMIDDKDYIKMTNFLEIPKWKY
jgi:hypothetical protein